jgi:hypothetical protein
MSLLTILGKYEEIKRAMSEADEGDNSYTEGFGISENLGRGK